MKHYNIKSLYYITHIDNIPGILAGGIYSHNYIEAHNIAHTKIYDGEIITRRKNKKLPNGDYLSDYVNLYFQPTNPMLYRVLIEKGGLLEGAKQIVIVEVSKGALEIPGAFFSDANAATSVSNFYEYTHENIEKLSDIVLNKDHKVAYWPDIQDGKSKIMAEVLIKHTIHAKYIAGIFTGHSDATQKIKEYIQNAGRNDIPPLEEKFRFFQPHTTYTFHDAGYPNVILAHGDMFYSGAKMLTISVNTVGVMGKGVASRAKYQFPDVYVEYQDVCRSQKLVMGTPYIIKRNKSIDEFYSDEYIQPHHKNKYIWFLLFPTKKHWRQNADLEGIQQGLDWMVKNCQQIPSIALPALGCGLGNLDWEVVVPMMFNTLKKLKDTKIIIYFPNEKTMPSREYVLRVLRGNSD